MNKYSDITKDFKINALSKDVGIAIDSQAVKDSILGLLMTESGERLYRPDIDGGLRSLLFENPTPLTSILAKNIIENTIKNFEPRADLYDINVNVSNNDYVVKVFFYIINNPNIQSLSFKL